MRVSPTARRLVAAKLATIRSGKSPSSKKVGQLEVGEVVRDLAKRYSLPSVSHSAQRFAAWAARVLRWHLQLASFHSTAAVARRSNGCVITTRGRPSRRLALVL